MSETSVLLKLKNVRGSFMQGAFEPKRNENDPKSKPAYSIGVILGPDHPQLEEIREAIEKVGKAEFKAEWPRVKKVMEAQDKLCLHDGDLKNYAGYAGNFYLSPRSYTRPIILDRSRNPITAEDGVLYSGCYINCNVEIWAQDDKKWGKRINCALKGIQFYRDGDALGGAAPGSVDDFDDLSDTGDGEDDLA